MFKYYTQLLLLTKRYGVVTMLLCATPFAFPYIKEYMDSEKENKSQKMVNIAIEKVINQMRLHHNILENKIDYNLEVSIESHKLHKLTDEQAIYVMSTAVGFQSISKVKWIENFIKHRRLDKHRENSYKKLIASELIRQSSIYITNLNTFVHPKLGKLGDYIKDNFDMKLFLNGLFVIIFNEHEDKKDRIEDCMYFMLDMQSQLWEKAKKDLK